MPKKIENARERLLQEAKKLLEQEGYEKLTMRSVANACGLGIGTAYNYFPSKNVLVASFMLEDWRQTLEKMQTCAYTDIRRLQFIYECLEEFIAAHKGLFSNPVAKTSYTMSAFNFHKPLREQLAEAIFPACSKDVFLSEFLAESILRWIVEGAPFAVLRPHFEKLMK